jgi:uncharacterized protein
MKVLYVTDIHDDVRNLRSIVSNRQADLLLLSGDLIYKAFFTEAKLYSFLEVQETLYSHLRKEKRTETPYELTLEILRNPDEYSEELLEVAKDYRILFQKAALNMKAKYFNMRSVLHKYAAAPFLLIPGNYDMDLQYTPLYEYDMHKKSYFIDDIHIGGYGGAPIITPGIPEMLSVAFNEYQEEGKLFSEPKIFFEKERPDILMIHNPAYGTLDKIPQYGRCGSFGIREFIDDYSPAIVLSGHVHEDYGLVRIGESFCLNPSNFGGVDTMSGYEAGGFFAECEIEKTKDKVFLKKVDLMRIINDDVHHIATVAIDRNFRASEEVYDEVQFSKLGYFLK